MTQSEVYVRPRARCATCGRTIELIGRPGNGRERWAHVGKPRGLAHFAKPAAGGASVRKAKSDVT